VQVRIHIGPEPCVAVRKGGGEASVGERIGQPLSLVKIQSLGADAVAKAEGNTYDEPGILPYAISSFCPTSADGLHSRAPGPAKGATTRKRDLVVGANGLAATWSRKSAAALSGRGAIVRAYRRMSSAATRPARNRSHRDPSGSAGSVGRFPCRAPSFQISCQFCVIASGCVSAARANNNGPDRCSLSPARGGLHCRCPTTEDPPPHGSRRARGRRRSRSAFS